jgi:outer membrane protein
MNMQLRKMALCLGLVAWPALGWGQSPAPSLPGKIGVINIQAAIAATGEGKKAFAELEKRYAPRRQDLQQQQQEINSLTDQLQKGQNTLSDDEQRRLNRELQEKQTRFKRAQEDAQADFQADNGEVVNRIGQKMVRLMDDYAQQNGYAVIIEGNPQLLYYVAPQIDLTEEVVKRYDAANPVTADAPATSSPGTTAPAAAAKPRTPASKPADKSKP